MVWRRKKETWKWIWEINKQLKRLFDLKFFVFEIWFLPRLPVRCGTEMSVKETRGWCKRAWAKKSELCVCVGGWGACVCVWRSRKGWETGCWGVSCYENSHKDRPSMIKGLVMLCKRNWRKKKYPKKKKKSLKRGQNKTVNFNQNEE